MTWAIVHVLPALLIALTAASSAAASVQTVVGGPGNDYQASVIRPWTEPQERIAVFERLDGQFNGDLWLTRSNDAGASWTAPVAIISSAGNERHASLVQTAENAFALFHLSNVGGSFRIHRASSADGSGFVAQGAINLGWMSGGEINPQVLREPDGMLTLSYHRLSGPAYLARSTDDGASWDQLQTQVSPGNAALPRLARREIDGRYLLVYQTGSNPVTVWTKTSSDPYDWSGTPVALVADGNNHDAWPLVLADGRFAVFWARVVAGAFQIHVSISEDGLLWSPPTAVSDRPGLANVQPFALTAEGTGRIELYWGAAQVAGSSNHDIVRLASLQLDPPFFADGFEAQQVHAGPQVLSQAQQPLSRSACSSRWNRCSPASRRTDSRPVE